MHTKTNTKHHSLSSQAALSEVIVCVLVDTFKQKKPQQQQTQTVVSVYFTWENYQTDSFKKNT